MRQRLFLIVFIAALAAFGTIGYGQAPPQPSPKMLAASSLYQQQKFAESASAFAEVLKDEPQNGRAWYLMGMSLHSLGKYDQAIPAFEKNLSINAQNANAMYNLACGYSRLKQNDKAFEWLNKAIATGPGTTFGAATDPDLEEIRKDGRFAKALDSIDRAKRPCMYSAESRQFDFWVGNWDVLTTQGQKAGTNNVTMFADGCSVMENWTATQGGNGKSINYYDRNTQKWYQFWIGSGGGALRYSGAFKDGKMILEGETTPPNGQTVKHRLTFSTNDDGSVRQFAETSTDEGKTWSVSYDFKYVKAK